MGVIIICPPTGSGTDIRPLNNTGASGFTGSNEFLGAGAPSVVVANRLDIGVSGSYDGKIRLISQATGFRSDIAIPVAGFAADRTITLPDSSGQPILLGLGVDPATSGNIAKVNRLGQTGSIGTGTKLTNATAQGAYMIHVYMSCSSAGAAGSTVTLTLVWTDDVGTKNVPVVLTSDSTGSKQTLTFPLWLQSGDITWGTARTGGTYNLRMRASFLG